MKQALPLLLSALLGASAACAAPQDVVDSQHTYPRFEISHFGFSMHRGMFTQSSGSIMLDTAAKTGRVDIAVQTASIDTRRLGSHGEAAKLIDGTKKSAVVGG